MPLLKLWNSIRGRSTQSQSADDRPAAATQAATIDAHVAPKTKRRPGLGIFGGGPHAALCKLVKPIAATSLLEISIGDGSRAIAVLETLAKTQENIRYAAIDQFEMAGGELTLKQFHQTMRAENIRPQVFPEAIERGLIRVARTIGAVDLVVIGAPLDEWHKPSILPLLGRVSHANTVIFYLDAETWSRHDVVAASGLSRAA
jgi:hypothetical protein